MLLQAYHFMPVIKNDLGLVEVPNTSVEKAAVFLFATITTQEQLTSETNPFCRHGLPCVYCHCESESNEKANDGPELPFRQ